MQPSTVERLLALNHQFYQTFAVQFSSTRQRLQNGIFQLIGTLVSKEALLDLGCGNAELASHLARAGFSGVYTGLDFSPGLIEEARETAQSIRALPGFEVEFLEASLAEPDWDKSLTPLFYEAATAFAVLHHLPGVDLRRESLRRVSQLLRPKGLLMLSVWQPLNAPRLQDHILTWETAGFSEDEMDPGDLLMDWRAGGSGMRYVHHFTSDELCRLADETGFQVMEEFTSDGKEGDLGLYQIWRKN